MRFILAGLIGLLLYSPTIANEPAPAPSQRFTLPLSDGTNTQAVFLAAPKNNLHLVYATRSGQLIVWNLSRDGPVPPPPPPPPPPPVDSLRIAVVHDPSAVNPKQRQVMADPAWRAAVPPPHKFAGIIPFGLLDPNTGAVPSAQAPFLKAAKGHALPCLVFLNESFAVVAVVPLPDSAAAILLLIEKHGNKTNVNTNNRRKQLQPSDRRKTQSLRPNRKKQETGLPATAIGLRQPPVCPSSYRLYQTHSPRGMGRPHQRRQGNLAA